MAQIVHIECAASSVGAFCSGRAMRKTAGAFRGITVRGKSHHLETTNLRSRESRDTALREAPAVSFSVTEMHQLQAECADSRKYQTIIFATAVRMVMRVCQITTIGLARRLGISRSCVNSWMRQQKLPVNAGEMWQKLARLYWEFS